jgi:putative FmdB family regulatory protein
MPTYEYVCKQCGDRFDIFQSFSAKPLKKHEVCGGPLQKVFHPAGVVFKGSGFYSTDSRSKPSSVSLPKDKGIDKGDGKPAKAGTEAGSSSGSSSTSTKSDE